jgi:hypothetical protein
MPSAHESELDAWELDDVVLGLGALGIAGEAAPQAEPAEVLAPGDELVDVRLVSGVEDDGVVR